MLPKDLAKGGEEGKAAKEAAEKIALEMDVTAGGRLPDPGQGTGAGLTGATVVGTPHLQAGDIPHVKAV